MLEARRPSGLKKETFYYKKEYQEPKKGIQQDCSTYMKE